MPAYIYRCDECLVDQEVEHSIKEDPDVPCGTCGASCRRIPQSFGSSFKGLGFYKTDKRNGQ
jgi:putative FmdB family regulatory protein